MTETRTTLRALAQPGAVLSLVVLALNDQWLKHVWPSWVTGKLSDVAGLVVAPLLLAVLLAVLRLPRPTEVALVATASGFVVCKTSMAGAMATSAVWSVFGTPTTIRADVTDLLALPALGAAWWIHRRAASDVDAGWRRTTSVAVGMAVLPVGVLATSATSPCPTDDGVRAVDAVTGRFAGTDDRLSFVVRTGYSTVRLDPGGSAAVALPDSDVARLREEPPTGSTACEGTGMQCWRVSVGDDRTVEVSTDGGVTWADDLVVSEDEQERSVDDVDPGCGDEASARLGQVAVLDDDGAVTVAATATHAGIWLRDATGTWRLVPRDVLDVPAVPNPKDGPRGSLQVVYHPPARSEEGWSGPPDTVTPRPGCASPSPTTVTPNPSNGPPTTYDVCT